MYLTLTNISKSFDEKIILDQANYTFQVGKIYGLLGRNGVGKTTLFNCISKNMSVDDGEMLLNGATYDNTEIGYVQSTPQLPTFMTGYEFVKYFQSINKDKIASSRTPEQLLERIGIDKEDHHLLMKDYSHGMKNKMQMLATFMVQPPVLLLDEPLTSFDIVAAHEMKELLKKIKSETIIILSTHIMQLARDLCDEIVLLHNHGLQGIQHEEFQNPQFEEHLIQVLKDQEEKV